MIKMLQLILQLMPLACLLYRVDCGEYLFIE